jgi:hypothetical protein
MGGREYLLLASYCGNDNPRCTNRRPCSDCLAMCNVFCVTDPEPVYLRQLGNAPKPHPTPPDTDAMR